MRSIEINLASDPFRNDVPLAAGLTVLALLAFGFAGWNTHAYMSARAHRTQLIEQQVGHRERMNAMRTEAERLRGALTRVDDKQLAAQAEFVAGVMDQRNFSWTRLFNALEDVTPWDTRLVAIRPIFQQGRVDLELAGVSQSMEAFFDFQTALLHAAQFRRVVPGDFQRIQPDRGVSFHLTVTYRPEVPPPPRPTALKAASEAPEEGAEQPAAAPAVQPVPKRGSPAPAAAAPAEQPAPPPPKKMLGQVGGGRAAAPPAAPIQQPPAAASAPGVNKVRGANAPQLERNRIAPSGAPVGGEAPPFPSTLRINPNAPRDAPPPRPRPSGDGAGDGSGGPQ